MSRISTAMLWSIYLLHYRIYNLLPRSLAQIILKFLSAHGSIFLYLFPAEQEFIEPTLSILPRASYSSLPSRELLTPVSSGATNGS